MGGDPSPAEPLDETIDPDTAQLQRCEITPKQRTLEATLRSLAHPQQL
jgi:hypothetical protein